MKRSRALLWDALLSVVLLAVLFALSASYLGATFASAIPGGWDGVAHYAIADLYAKRLFPALSGWLPQYFAGMPFPNLYPPILYLLVGLGTKVGASTATAFLGVEVLATAAVPVLTFACGRRLFGQRGPSLLAGLASIAFLVQDSDFAKNGIALRGTFEAGLASHTLGYCSVLAFLAFLLGAARSRTSAAFAGLSLGLVPLANVHVVPAAALLLVTLATAALSLATSWSARRALIVRYAWIAGSALLVSAVWVLPLLLASPYVVTQSLEAPPFRDLLHAVAGPLACVLVALAVALRRGDARVCAVTATVLVLAVLAMVSPRVFANLSIQPARLVAAALFLGAFPAAYLVAAPRSARGRALALLGCTAALVFGVRPVRQTDATVRPTQWKDYAAVLAALGGRTDGRVLVESGGDPLSDRFALQALVGQSGSFSLTTVFREASISSLFAVPLRNAFSSNGESFAGVDSKAPSPIDAAEPIERTRARLAAFHVRYLAVTSESAKARVAALPGAYRMTDPGTWELYGLRSAPRDASADDPSRASDTPDARGDGYAIVPPYEPVLTFAPFSVKRRADFAFDFVRLGEEAFSDGRTDTTLALARTARLDREDFGPFPIALVTEYRYDDAERAFAKLDAFSREHTLVLLSDEDPLFRRLEALARSRPTVRVVPRSPGADRVALASAILASSAGQVTEASLIADRVAVHQTCRSLFDALAAARIPVPRTLRVDSAVLDGERTSIRLSGSPTAPTPLLVRQTYSPEWKSRGGEPLYLASPTFALLFAGTQSVELRADSPRGSRVGAACSALGILVLALGLFAKPRARARVRPALPAAPEAVRLP